MKPKMRIGGSPSIIVTSDGALTVILPVSITRRAGRKRIGAPKDVMAAASASDLTSLQRALARGFRWRGMLESGEVASAKEIAERESTDNSYVGRIIKLTLLAPEIIAGILDDTVPDVQIDRLGMSPPLLWSDQLAVVGISPASCAS
ncbi:LacI family transcriptional regulator [Lysobacter sp. Hz 25]|uniref:LacI family transcriptional regulator n=1 Tax=Lysobacter sp. Hz 25 TaxID=3383698 RepID=UPI0038D404BA